MIDVAGVRFKKTGKIYYFDPLDSGASVGDDVIVETVRGLEFGNVILLRTFEDEEFSTELKPVIRIATQDDQSKNIDNRNKSKEAIILCDKKIKEHNLDMKLISCEYTFDNSKLLFYFTSDGRVDFRELVRDLAAIFKTRIELRQIGVRDEAKLVGGLGCCGRPTCCSTFLSEFSPVSIKMAKDQNLSLNPTKISGVCGRLMCCLKYEQKGYECINKIMPKVGEFIITEDGKATVISTYPIQELIKASLIVNDETVVSYFNVKDIKRTGKFNRDFLDVTAENKETYDEKELSELEKE
ncbi:stage 0 sporulation family protein [Peptoniphilus lacrimalis]|uniref:PSP1 C-terminal domain protein n=1 Tax=Peptoniphilus lacrimalis 315-B TaxID=596330 RepID=D1VSU1_9FIRM|nr:stage 0 sporulation family protein [Peptoniphilus lacrimalis]EFA90411.1 PSP1 C-terminal domain protein [Peptoniphilus lacrimalis 315-B]